MDRTRLRKVSRVSIHATTSFEKQPTLFIGIFMKSFRLAIHVASTLMWNTTPVSCRRLPVRQQTCNHYSDNMLRGQVSMARTCSESLPPRPSGGDDSLKVSWRCILCTYVYMYICVYMHAYAYGCVCASLILLDTLRRCC